MDIADYIGYSVHHFEDGVALGAIDVSKLTSNFQNTSDQHSKNHINNIAQNALKYIDKDHNANMPTINEIEKIAKELFWQDFFIKSFTNSPKDLADLKNTTSSLISRFIENSQEEIKKTNIEIAILKALSLGAVINPYQNSSETEQHINLIKDLFEKLYSSFENLITPEESLIFSLDTSWALSTTEKKTRAVIDYIACLTDNSVKYKMQQLF